MVVLLLLAVMCLVHSAAAACDYPPRDICITIDQTKSVGATNYVTMLEAIKDLVASYNVGPDNDHVSIVTFHGKVFVRSRLDDSQYHSVDALKALIQEMQDNDVLGSPTRTDLALDTVNKEVYTAANGDRPDSPDILIVFTDGGKAQNSMSYDEVLPPLVEKGVHRIAVGIGKSIAQEELITIAGSEENVINAKSFGDLGNKLKEIEEATCNEDGGYTEWSEWSECSATCGGGSRTHSRTCTNPPVKNGGKTCEEQDLGPAEESEECNTQECPQPGGYTEWSEWGECSVTCGGGVQKRSRTCTNPPPAGGGPSCTDQGLGPAEEEQECNAQECPIDGGYTDWSEWGECSVTCGGGVQKRSRTCTNPPASAGGKSCTEQDLGPAEEEQECNAQECPEDGGYTDWSEWGECSVTCGGGVQKRSRTCTNPPPSGGGKSCTDQDLGPAEEQQECNAEPCEPDKCEIPPLDVAIVIDKTKSLRRDHYISMLNSIKNFIGMFNVGKKKTHIAVVSFAGKAKARNLLKGRVASKKKRLRKLLDKMKNEDLSSPTRTDLALEKVFTKVFTSANGDRPGNPNIIVVFTDGGLHHTAKPYSEVIPKDSDAHRVAVGIGRKVKRDELEKIADSPDRVVMASSFDQLEEKLGEIREAACKK